MTTRLSISFVGMTDTGLDSDPRPKENTQVANRIQINKVHTKELSSQQHKREDNSNLLTKVIIKPVTIVRSKHIIYFLV